MLCFADERKKETGKKKENLVVTQDIQQLYFRQVTKDQVPSSGTVKLAAFRPRPKDNRQLSIDAASFFSPPPSPAQQVYELHHQWGTFTVGSWSVDQAKTPNLTIISASTMSHPSHALIVFPQNEDDANALTQRLRDDAVCCYTKK